MAIKRQGTVTKKMTLGLFALVIVGNSGVARAQEEPLPSAAAPTPAPPPPAPPPTYVARPVASQPVSPLNGIHFNPAGLALGVIGLGYERVLANWASLRFEAQYTRDWYSKDDVWAVGGTVRPFFFLARRAPRGMYLSPLLTLAYAEGHNSAFSAHGAGWSVGATVGYSWLIANVLNIRLGGGVQYASIAVSGEGETSNQRIGMRGIYPAADLSFGFVF